MYCLCVPHTLDYNTHYTNVNNNIIIIITVSLKQIKKASNRSVYVICYKSIKCTVAMYWSQSM